MWLLYKTDNQHSYASENLIAVCDSKHMALSILEANHGFKLIGDDYYNFLSINQTQNLEEDYEYVVREIEINQQLQE